MCPKHQHPCLHCHPHGYIRMVQHLIERCLLFHMNRDECVRALAKHAYVQPIVTLTVWKELIKENTSFFHAYLHGISPSRFHYGSKQRSMLNSKRIKAWQ